MEPGAPRFPLSARPRGTTSGRSSLKQYRMPERGARIARRDDRVYWSQVSDERRREAGCPARQTVLIQRGQAASHADSSFGTTFQDVA
jgi:hypothetical protein